MANTELDMFFAAWEAEAQKTVKLLLESGADRDAINARGKTPRSLAAAAVGETAPKVRALLAAATAVPSVRRTERRLVHKQARQYEKEAAQAARRLVKLRKDDPTGEFASLEALVAQNTELAKRFRAEEEILKK